jgi:hypothetical protein
MNIQELLLNSIKILSTQNQNNQELQQAIGQLLPKVTTAARATSTLNEQLSTRILAGSQQISLERQIEKQASEETELLQIRREVSAHQSKSQYCSKQLEFLNWCDRNKYQSTVTSTRIMQFVKNEVLIS